ncbi:chitin synthase-domain-containing protein [Mycena amicta]|nr:chitin synthase-domain-containing protein [Mycena amicta]
MQFVVGMELARILVLPAAISFTIYLIVASIIPHHTNTTVPLVLLAFVLDIPLILIVITSRKIVYIGWMLIDLLSLPIWNGILPASAFWHFDEPDAESDKEGEFDSSHIVMKRWAEFERERRWRSGTTSREEEAGYGWKAESNRYSLASNSDNYHPPSGVDSSTMDSANNYLPAPRARHDTNAVLMLPTPLAVSRTTTHSGSSGPTSSTSSVSGGGAMARSSEEAFVTSPQSASVDMWATCCQQLAFAAAASAEGELQEEHGRDAAEQCKSVAAVRQARERTMSASKRLWWCWCVAGDAWGPAYRQRTCALGGRWWCSSCCEKFAEADFAGAGFCWWSGSAAAAIANLSPEPEPEPVFA